MTPYIFSECAVPVKPDTEITKLLEKCGDGVRYVFLTREEKDRIAEILYGLFGSHSSVYKLHGWAWPMHRVLRKFLIQFKYDSAYHPFFAPDKTSIRKALKGNPITDIVETKKKH